MSQVVDQTALKFNQACIVALVALAYVADLVVLVAFVGLVLLVGTVVPRAGLFKAIYGRVFRPLGLLRADPQPDDPRPHLFAQGMGGAVLAVAAVLLALGATVVGWVLALLVVVLAGVNLVFGFCAGCFLYYQLSRLGVLSPSRIHTVAPGDG